MHCTCRWTQSDGEIGLQGLYYENDIIQSEKKKLNKKEKLAFREKIYSSDVDVKDRVLSKIDKISHPSKLRVLWKGKRI